MSDKDLPHVDIPEIILNLWYICDELGTVYSLRGRCYLGSGMDFEKLALLHQFAATDYLIAQAFPIPERLHTIVVTEDGEHKVPVTNSGALARWGGPEILFEEVFVELEKQLPAQTDLSIGKDPLICITPLLAAGDGTLRPITSPNRPLDTVSQNRSAR